MMLLYLDVKVAKIKAVTIKSDYFGIFVCGSHEILMLHIFHRFKPSL